MGFRNKMFGKKKKEEEVLKALDGLDKTDATEKTNLEESEDVSDLEEQWLQKRTGETAEYGKGQEQEQEQEEEQGLEEAEKEKNEEPEDAKDDLMASLKLAGEEQEKGLEQDRVLVELTQAMGHVSADELLELGRAVLQEMRERKA